MAKWSVRDDFYYPGRILSCQKNDKYQVLFDDGNKRQVNKFLNDASNHR